MRFDDKSCAGTRIRYMTDGMLLREALRDSALSRYQVNSLASACNMLESVIKIAEAGRTGSDTGRSS